MNIGPRHGEFVRGSRRRREGTFGDLEFSVPFSGKTGEKAIRGREAESLRAKVQFQDSVLKSRTGKEVERSADRVEIEGETGAKEDEGTG